VERIAAIKIRSNDPSAVNEGCICDPVGRFEELFIRMGRPSIPPIISAGPTLLQAILQSPHRALRAQLMEQINYNLLFFESLVCRRRSTMARLGRYGLYEEPAPIWLEAECVARVPLSTCCPAKGEAASCRAITSRWTEHCEGLGSRESFSQAKAGVVIRPTGAATRA